jgi:hypothetical protein
MLLGALLPLLASCNDDAPDDAAETPQATRAAAEDISPAASAAVSPARSPARTPAPGSPAPSGAFESYRYAVTIGFNVVGEESAGINGTIDGEYLAPDSHAFSQAYQLAGLEASNDVVIIGDDAWEREGDGDWETTDRDAINVDLTSADPDFFTDADFAEDIAVFDSEPDEVGGRQARRYSFDREQLAQVGELLGEDFFEEGSPEGIQEFEFTVWVDDETDALLRAEIDATATAEALGETGLAIQPGQVVHVTLTLELRDVNDTSIVIEPPI